MIELNVFSFIILLFVYIHIGFCIYSIYVHRYIIHKSISFNKYVEFMLKFICWIFIGIPNKYLIASHRKHHQFSDKEEDPHSPHHINFIKFWIINPLHKIKSLLYPFNNEYKDHALDQYIVNDKNYEKSFMYRYTLGHYFFIFFNTLLFGIGGLLLSIVYLVLIIFLARWLIGWIHIFGYKNFATTDCSKNLFPFAFLFGGEELHNNHHKYPRKFKMSHKKWEFDISYFYILILKKLKLCKIIH